MLSHLASTIDFHLFRWNAAKNIAENKIPFWTKLNSRITTQTSKWNKNVLTANQNITCSRSALATNKEPEPPGKSFGIEHRNLNVITEASPLANKIHHGSHDLIQFPRVSLYCEVSLAFLPKKKTLSSDKVEKNRPSKYNEKIFVIHTRSGSGEWLSTWWRDQQRWPDSEVWKSFPGLTWHSWWGWEFQTDGEVKAKWLACKVEVTLELWRTLNFHD